MVRPLWSPGIYACSRCSSEYGQALIALASQACERCMSSSEASQVAFFNRRPQINNMQSALRQPNTDMMQDGYPLPCIPSA